MNLAQLKINKFDIGDLVWIPANTDLYSHPTIWVAAKTLKEPTYGLVVEMSSIKSRILIGDQLYYVGNKNVYGEKYDY